MSTHSTPIPSTISTKVRIVAGLLPLNLNEVIHESLKASTRESDGLLHCSGDLVGSLRHTMLYAAGAPIRDNDLMSSVILETGTLWHERIARMLVKQGCVFMQEVKLNQWLPEGWGGTADWIFWHPEYEAFVLGDLKTTAGEALPFIEREGIKEAHHHQLSAYWYACVKAGLPMVKGLAVLYMPKNRAKTINTEPILVEAEPLDKGYMEELMYNRRTDVDEYLDSLWAGAEHFPELETNYIQSTLAPPIERVQKAVWAGDHFDMKIVPHWSAQFCPYDDALCNCSSQGETKIGEYTAGTDEVFYKPRKGYEDIRPIALNKTQLRRLSVA